MKRSLKRSGLLGMLAVLLTMSLVAAFGATVAVAGEAHGEDQRNKRSEQCKPKGSQQSDRDEPRGGDECDEEAADEKRDKSNANSASENNREPNGKNDDHSTNPGTDNKGKSEAKSNNEAKSNAQRKSKGNKSSKTKNEAKSNSKSKSDSNDQSRSTSGNKSGNAGESNGGSSGKSSESNGRSKEARNNRSGSGTQKDTHPPGNNGTVKIDGIPFGDHPNNEPHPGCVFEVDFYNYDEGDLYASATFTSHPPTNPSGQVVLSESVIFIGEDAAGGGTDLDATRTYMLDLSGYTAHDRQGHHIKLTVNAEGSQGADTKHKVFWVDCVADFATDDDEVEGVDEDTPDEVESGTEDDVDEARDEIDDDSVLGTRVDRAAPDHAAVVQGEVEVAAQEQEGAEVRSAVLPFTGAGLAVLALLGAGLIGTGASFMRSATR